MARDIGRRRGAAAGPTCLAYLDLSGPNRPRLLADRGDRMVRVRLTRTPGTLAGVVTSTSIAYHAYVNRDLMTTRRAPSGIAPLLQELELRRPSVVTKRLLAEVIDATGWKKSVRDAADRLVREGWLLPLRSREAWEFVPASRAAAIPSGDP